MKVQILFFEPVDVTASSLHIPDPFSVSSASPSLHFPLVNEIVEEKGTKPPDIPTSSLISGVWIKGVMIPLGLPQWPVAHLKRLLQTGAQGECGPPPH